MLKRLGMLAFFMLACSWVPAQADDFAPVKCGTNQERVWVYDSLTAFNVQAQIRCGENVQIISRTKGYVKVRIKDGSEGYVTDSSLPSLPPLDESATKAPDAVAAAPTDNSLGAIARRLAAARDAAAAPPAAVASTTTPNPAESRVSASAPVAASVPSRPLPAKAVSAPATENTVATAAVASVAAAKVPEAPTAPPVASAVNASLPSAAAVSANVRAAPAVAVSLPVPQTVATAAIVIVQHPTSPKEIATAAAAVPDAASPVARSVIPVSKPAPPAASHTVAVGAKASVSQPPVNTIPNPPVSNPAPVQPRPAPPATTETVANVPAASPVRDAPAMRNVSASVPSEDFPDFQPPVSESADPACQFYFSAYGLAPSQIKWMEQNRKKEFPNVCPAPEPSKVDFVVIFTHDVGGYSETLPTPVHTDRNGFSDFSATVGVDTAAQSNSDADKAHRQFVWVFTMRRGAFDPSTFSPRRRYQFTKLESSSTGSKAGVKTVEDAFQFVTQQTPNR